MIAKKCGKKSKFGLPLLCRMKKKVEKGVKESKEKDREDNKRNNWRKR